MARPGLEGQNTFLEGHDFRFYYIFTTNFSGNRKIYGGTAPECPPVATGLGGHCEIRVSFATSELGCKIPTTVKHWP